MPADVARMAPGCGKCHQFGNGQKPVVSLVPSKRSLDLSESITVTTSATGGVPHPQNAGGFIAEASVGKFTAGAGMKTDTTGAFVTHTSAANNNRTWAYGYSAPATPGRWRSSQPSTPPMATTWRSVTSGRFTRSTPRRRCRRPCGSTSTTAA